MNQHVYLTPLVSTANRSGFLYPRLLSAPPPGIIDLSQVPHLPVLVPPSAGATSSPMDRITYIPGGSTTFPGRPYTTSPISPGTHPRPPPSRLRSHHPIVSLPAFPVQHKPLFCPSAPPFFCSWVFAHKQDAGHVV